MDAVQTWLLVAAGLGFALGAGVSWALAVLRWNRLSSDYRNQLLRSEQARQFVLQQSDQAKRQIELLQREVGELRVMASRVRAGAGPSRAEENDLGEDLLLQAGLPDRERLGPSGDGFATTQVAMPRGY
jgi:hypothetical protein